MLSRCTLSVLTYIKLDDFFQRTVGTAGYTGQSTYVYDVKTKLPQLYSKLTKNNFYIFYTCVDDNRQGTSDADGYLNMLLSDITYDSLNGSLSIKFTSGGRYSSYNDMYGIIYYTTSNVLWGE